MSKNPHRYLVVLYIRVVILTVATCALLSFVLPNVIETSGNSAWNDNAVNICADVVDIHIVEFYRNPTTDPSTNPQPYYNGYVTTKYSAYNRNYTYEFIKFSSYMNKTQLNMDLHSCCEIHHCINIYYEKNNPGDARETLMNTHAFPSWLSGLIGGILIIAGCSYANYRYDYKYRLELLLIQTLGDAGEFIT
jgi:hypothetical protein